jgi:3-oxoacyl-[acyl-carrier-protein] synthase-3
MDNSEDAGRAPYRARLAAAGRHLPDTRLTTDELMSTTRHNTHIDLERLTGIHERRVSLGDEDSYSLAVKAARNCLDKAQRDGSSLDVVINCSITKLHGGLTQWLEPTMSGAVARAIGAKRDDLRCLERVRRCPTSMSSSPRLRGADTVPRSRRTSM